MASTTRVEDAAADAVAADRAAAAPKKEKEKRASAGFATPPLISRPSARCGLKAMAFPKKEAGGGSAPDQQTGSAGGGASRGRANYRGRTSSCRGPSLSTLASTTAPARRDAHLPVPEDEEGWVESEN
jgi:hypothetical protein